MENFSVSFPRNSFMSYGLDSEEDFQEKIVVPHLREGLRDSIDKVISDNLETHQVDNLSYPSKPETIYEVSLHISPDRDKDYIKQLEGEIVHLKSVITDLQETSNSLSSYIGA